MSADRQVNAYLISQGHTLESAAAVPTPYRLDIWRLMQGGILGYNAQASQVYLLFTALHSIQQTMVGMVSKKGWKPEAAPEFERIFPGHSAGLEWANKEPEPNDLGSAFRGILDGLRASGRVIERGDDASNSEAGN